MSEYIKVENNDLGLFLACDEMKPMAYQQLSSELNDREKEKKGELGTSQNKRVIKDTE